MNENRESFAQRLIGWFAGNQVQPADDKTVILRGRPTELNAPRRLDENSRYEHLRVLGKGAYGVVLLARDLKIGRLLAIKQLNSEMRQNSDVFQHFLQEARIAGQLDDPNIVTIFDVKDGATPCILMEYLGGDNLERVIRSKAPMEELEALTIMSGIMKGLSAAHSIGVVHRDVKPSNILFDHNFTPKISDFGVAMMPVEAGGIDDETTRRTYVVGTPDYMAPEQLRPNAITVDDRADLYAAGLMLFEMLTGKRFQSFATTQTRRELLEGIKALTLPKDSDFPTTITAQTRELIRSLIRFVPDERPSSAAAVRVTLEKIMAGHLGPEPRVDADKEEHSVRLEMFADILRLFLVDGVISAGERSELKARSFRLGLKVDEAMELEECVRVDLSLPSVRHLREYANLAETLLVDRDFSVDDRETLDELGLRRDISEPERRRIEANVMSRFQMKDGTVEDLIP